ncbi:MAG: hypothetical protein ABJE95_19230 [Byssovorax sp.]
MRQVEIVTETGIAYQACLRSGTSADRADLEKLWLPMLERGPETWLDRDWPWRTFGISDLHLDENSDWLVLADELEAGASGELFGVLVTTGPATTQQLGLDALLPANHRLLWLEYVAIGPSIRPDCPSRDRRQQRVKGVGRQLMCAAIDRSFDLGVDGKIGLHAEGPSANVYTGWGMRRIGNAAHRAGGSFPVFFGDATWAAGFSGRTR